MPFNIDGQWVPKEEAQSQAKKTKQRPVKVVEQKRKNKMITSVLNLPHTESEKQDMLWELKRLCASGGTLKDGVIELQGCHKEKVQKWLKENKGKKEAS